MFERFSPRPDRKTAILAEPGPTDRYLENLADCVDAARLNDLYPPTAAISSSLEALMPAVHRGTHDKLEVDCRSGLPTYREYVRVTADGARAAEELSALGAWIGREGAEIYDRLAAKRAYYEALLELGPFMGESRKIYFRKVDPDTSMAMFRIVLDRIGPSGLLERLTVELSQRSGLWGRRELQLTDDDAVEMSEDLKGLVYRLMSHDVELIFLRLIDDPNLSVELVVKGTVGPFLFAGLTPEEDQTGLCATCGDGALLQAGLSLASLQQQRDVFNDPLVRQPRFSVEAREELFGAQEREPYHVLADRKFVLCGADRAMLDRLLEQAGTSNIVYEI